MKTPSLILLGLLMTTTSAFAAKVWSDKVQCNVTETYYDLTATEIAQVIKKEETSQLVSLTRKDGETVGDTTGKLVASFPLARAEMKFYISFSNIDYHGVPKAQKRLYLSDTLKIDGQVGGIINVATEGADTEAYMSNDFAMMAPINETVNEYRLAHPEDKSPAHQVIKKLYPDMKTAAIDFYISCTAYDHEVTDVGNHF